MFDSMIQITPFSRARINYSSYFWLAELMHLLNDRKHYKFIFWENIKNLAINSLKTTMHIYNYTCIITVLNTIFILCTSYYHKADFCKIPTNLREYTYTEKWDVINYKLWYLVTPPVKRYTYYTVVCCAMCIYKVYSPLDKQLLLFTFYILTCYEIWYIVLNCWVQCASGWVWLYTQIKNRFVLHLKAIEKHYRPHNWRVDRFFVTYSFKYEHVNLAL